MLKSHFKINKDEEIGREERGEEAEPEPGPGPGPGPRPGSGSGPGPGPRPGPGSPIVTEEAGPEEAGPEEEAERITDLDTTHLKKSQVCIRLSHLGKTADNDGYAFIKASLTDMGLTNISIIKCFKNLQFLDLSSNLLTLDALQVVTELPYLVLLKADKNNIHAATLHKMPYFQVLIMNENLIKSVEDIFQPNLSTLELGFNKIKEINFKNRMSEMKVLDFRNNQISCIENLDFPNLDSLYLAYNKISSLEGIAKLVNLRILHLRGNPIRLLNGFGKGLSKLVYLNLRTCKVSTILQIKKLRVLPKLETLILKGCPIVGGTGNEAEDPADAEEDTEIRNEILASLPRLKRLNKGEFTPEEREEAKALMMQWLEEGEKDEEEIELEEIMEAEQEIGQ